MENDLLLVISKLITQKLLSAIVIRDQFKTLSTPFQIVDFDFQSYFVDIIGIIHFVLMVMQHDARLFCPIKSCWNI